uniref:Wall-associated receptor kinase C-terminal domain-containing protein n=1 Tax=Aegilops tauschii subsp. strangulata TaxID=200361 RepID=A0A453S863_AEGTS
TVYWRAVGDKFPPYDQVPDYGVRVDFEIPVTTRCLQCQDRRRGANGTCGFDPATRDFVCICDGGRNSTTDCAGALSLPLLWLSVLFGSNCIRRRSTKKHRI